MIDSAATVLRANCPLIETDPDATRDAGRSRRALLRPIGASLGAAALVASTGLTTAGGDEDHRENGESPARSRKGPLYVHGPTTRYQPIDEHPPGIFGDLENRSERTVWIARLDVEFYAEDGRQLGTRAQYFLRIRPGERREIALPFDAEYFDGRVVTLASGVVETVLGNGRIVSERANAENDR